MYKTYTEDIGIRTLDCDLMGTWRPSAILGCMQEVAGTHSELLGVGRNALLEKDMAWVITRMEVELDRCPHIGETVSMETYPTATRRWFFPRYYLLRDAQGNEFGRAATLWVLLNLKSRRMVQPDAVASLLPDNRDLPMPLGLPAPVTEISGTVETADRVPVYTDLDTNLHVNNTRYLDWACNALGVETMTAYELGRFAVNYNQEVRAGQEVHTVLHRFGTAFSYSGFAGETRLFDVGGVLRERERAY